MNKFLWIALIAIIVIGGGAAVYLTADNQPPAPKAAPKTESTPTTETTTQTSTPAQQEKETGTKVVVYYLHGYARCSNCIKFENFTTSVVQDSFKNVVKNGKLVLKVLNFEQEPYKHFIDDYQLYTKAVIVSKIIDGEEKDWKNLEKIWEYVRDEATFRKYIRDEVNAMLKDI